MSKLASTRRLAACATILGALTGSSSARADRGAFEKGPYLQALGASGVTVKVELEAAAPATLEVTLDGADADGGAPAPVRREDTDARVFHALRVDGLTPATRYAYRVSSGGASEAGHFTTAPVDGRPFRFLAYGDSRSDAAAHGIIVKAMRAAPGDFLVNSGDMVARGSEPSEWSELFNLEGPLIRDRCLFVAVGNHELTRSDRGGDVAFLKYFAEEDDEGRDRHELYGSFRWGNTRFFVLNAMDNWTGDERAWLRSALDASLTEPGIVHRFALLHWGPFSAGPHGNNPALASGEVIGIMRDREVDLVIAGHDHDYERGEGQGLKYIVTGGSGAPLYEKKHEIPETRRFESAYHFVEVSVDGDRVAITARRSSGGVLESCAFRGTGSWDCDGASSDAGPGPSAPPPRSTASSRCGCATPGSSPANVAGILAVGGLSALAAARPRRRRARR